MKNVLLGFLALMLAGTAWGLTVNPASNVTGDSAATRLTIIYRDENADFAAHDITVNDLTISGSLAATGALSVSSITASGSGGILMTDDGGNTGIFLENGGDIGIGLTNPGEKLDIVGGTGIYVRTKAQLDAITPSRGGVLYACSNCTVPFAICISTGTGLSDFRQTISANVTTGCGTDE